ncbi:MAG: hypothetical protein O3C43_18840 [Verrucomicrobia bacterium]|nr:hypothetical protein [Verrucomicrobiota bacterium]MDA1068545.1 hypothetical protein [Verrucomicrobiota bacterium]
MNLSLFTATIITGICLVLAGGLLFWNDNSISSLTKSLPRSRRFTILAFGIGSIWFIYKVSQLGEADFGNHRNLLMGIFGAIAVLSYFYVPDFLAVRGVCIIWLLAATEMLSSAFALYDITSRLFLTVFAYFLIVLSIYLAVVPYRARDFFDWLFMKDRRPRLLGAVLAGYGVILSIVAFAY